MDSTLTIQVRGIFVYIWAGLENLVMNFFCCISLLWDLSKGGGWVRRPPPQLFISLEPLFYGLEYTTLQNKTNVEETN